MKTTTITKTLPTPAHLPESMISSVELIPENKRLILFTRHSLRERSDGQGFASYKLPLTSKGRVLARAWGQWLAENLSYSLDTNSISSPIQRCVDTASLMQEGAGIRRDIAHQSLLVEPGSLVLEPELASPLFKEIGALNFINRFLQDELAGTKSAHQGGTDILSLLYRHQPQPNHLTLAISHDTLLSAFLGVMMGTKEINWNDWPKMMEGVFLWFDDEADGKASDCSIDKSKPPVDLTVNFIWRGEVFVTSIAELTAQINK